MEQQHFVSVFDGVTSNKPSNEVELSSILTDIKSGKYKDEIFKIREAFSSGKEDEAQELKRQLTAFTTSGTFHFRSKSGLKKHSTIICLDYDNVTDLESARKLFAIDTHTYSCFTSPSGNGLKVFVKVDMDQFNHEEAFKKADDYFFEKVSIRSDQSCKDVTRLCFVSYDPDLYINEESNIVVLVDTVKIDGQKQWEKELKMTESFTEKHVKFEEGSRNVFVHQFSSNANRFGIPLFDAIQYAVREFVESNFNEDEIISSVNSGYSNTEEFGKYAYEIEPIVEQALGMSVLDLISRPKRIKEEMFIWDGIVQPSVGFIFGLSKVGKTTLSESLAKSLAVGHESFLGRKINGRKRVLLVSLEEYIELRRDRLSNQINSLTEEEKLVVSENLLINADDFPGYLSTEKDFDLLREYIRQRKPDVVIIDSLSHIRPGSSIEDSSSASDLMKIFKVMASEFNVAIIIIHHTIKAVSDGLSLTINTMAGSRILSQEADFMYGVNGTPKGQRYMKDIALRYKKSSEKVTVFEIMDSNLIEFIGYEHEDVLLLDFDGRSDRTNYNLIHEFIQEKKEVNTPSLMSQFVDSKVMTKTALYKNLEKLETDGKVTKPAKALYRAVA